MRIDYAAFSVVVPGMWEEADSGQHKIDKLCGLEWELEVQHALDNFRSASDSVASGIQSSHRRWVNSLAAGCGAGPIGDQPCQRQTRGISDAGPFEI